jgi:predicted  nucleic acid-binding Zn-ribbon protein
MQQVVRQLLAIRDIDSEIKELEDEFGLLPSEREAIASKLASARQEIDDTRQNLETDELEERQIESKMNVQEALLTKLNDQTAQVTSTQAYEAIQTEIQHANEAGSEFETRALELMESIDASKTRLAKLEEELAELDSSSTAEIEGIATREGTLTAARNEKQEARRVAGEGLDTKLLSRYDRVLQQKHPAVIVLEGNSCPECRMVLPRQIVSTIKRGEEIHACSNCRRLVVPIHLLE